MILVEVDTVVIPAKQMTDADLSKILEHERKKPFHEQVNCRIYFNLA